MGFFAIRDPDLATGCCRAFNDWLAGYCSVAPDGLKGTASLPLGSMAAAVDVARRAITELGFASIMVPCAVFGRGPDSHDNDPIYDLAQELDVPVGVHAGGPRFANDRFVDAYATLHALEFAFDVMYAAAAIVCGGVLERFPRLRVALLEAGSGWGPYLFERLDEHYEKRTGEMPAISKPPSEYLRDGRVVVSCEAERHLPHALAGLGAQTVAYASDYPHWDCEFPESVRKIADRDDLTDEQKRAVLGDNALRLYGGAL
jgi:predicted TIM-barrel fold metal-dependent hydrolase